MGIRKEWVTIKILKALKVQIDQLCADEKNGFVNPTQYVQHVIKNDLDERKGLNLQ